MIGKRPLADCDAVLEIQTQQSFKPSPPEEGGEESEIRSGGKFDIVIESQTDLPFVVVVESKVASGFGEGQLPCYKGELNDPDSFPGVAIERRFLITLTSLGETTDLTDVNLKWSEVHKFLVLGQPNDVFVHSTLKQFAEFLKLKGLGQMELQKVTSELLKGWSQSKTLENQLRGMVEKLRLQKQVKEITGRKQVKLDSGWIGVEGRDAFWAGFGIHEVGKASELFLWVEITLPGDRRVLVKSLPEPLAKGFTMAEKYVNAVANDD